MSTTTTTAPAKAALPNEGRPGYKHTKLGWIPEEWQAEKIGKHLQVLTDFESNGSFADVKANVKVYDQPEYAWYVRATDLENDSHLDNVRYVDKATYDFLKKTMLHGGEVLVMKRGDIGKVYRYLSNGKPATLAPNLYLVRCKPTLDNEFLYRYLTSGLGTKELRRINGSTTIGAIYKDDFKALKVICPTIVEQRRIAAVLGAWDRAIATAQQLLAAQQERKRGLMQELLTGKRRFPGFGGKWKEVRLGDVVTKAKGSVVASTNDSTGTPVIDASSYEGGATLYSTDEQALRCNESDVLLLWDGSKAGRAMTGKTGIVGSTFVLLKPKTELHPVFLTAILTHDEQRIMAVREGSGIPHVPKDFLRWYRFLLPPLKEQEAIIRTIQGLEQIENSLKAQMDHLTTQKRGLMQQLLTGAVRMKH